MPNSFYEARITLTLVSKSSEGGDIGIGENAYDLVLSQKSGY